MGIVAYGAPRVFEGYVPYRDFWSNYGTLQHCVVAVLFKVFGTSVRAGRLLAALM